MKKFCLSLSALAEIYVFVMLSNPSLYGVRSMNFSQNLS